MVVAFGVGDGARNQAIDGLNFLIERGSDGLIVMSNAMEDETLALGPFQSKVVVINQDFPASASSASRWTTRPADAGGAHCWNWAPQDRGDRGPRGGADNQQRIAGFKAELEAAGIDTSKMWMEDGEFTPEGGLPRRSCCSRARVHAVFAPMMRWR
jgi:LacI family transcriptional regulator